MLLPLLLSSLVVSEHRVHMRAEPDLYFSLQVPSTWMFSDELTTKGRRRFAIFASMHTGTDESVRVGEYAEIDGRRVRGTSPQITEAQLDPGTVYVEVGTSSGMDSGCPYYWSEASGPKEATAALDDSVPVDDGEETEFRSARFRRWGWEWYVSIVARRPFESSHFDEAVRIVRSIRFRDAPISSREHAIEACAPLVSEDVLPWGAFGSCHELTQHYDIVTKDTPTGYLVEFRVLDGTSAREIVRADRYRVDLDGCVQEVGPQQPLTVGCD